MTETGAYQLDLPIEVPAFYGIEPRVGLSYSSAGGNGTVGVGWRLVAGSTIRRQSSTYGAPRYDASDIFFVDGRELVGCNGVPSASCDPSLGAGTHVFRIEDFQRIVFDESGNTWTITARDGTAYRYVPLLGDTSDAARTYTWGLQTVDDTAGHRVHYQSLCDGLTCYIDYIAYGDGENCIDPGSSVTGARIDFAWQLRSDTVSIGTGLDSFPFETVNNRLQSITVWHMNQVMRDYQLAYVPASGSATSMLSQVYERGSDLVTVASNRMFTSPAMTTQMAPVPTALPPVPGFGLGPVAPSNQNLPLTWTGAASVVPWTDPNLTPYRDLLADVDGDGRVDYVQWTWADTQPSSTMHLFTRLAGTTSSIPSHLDWDQYFIDWSGCTGVGTPECYPATEAHVADVNGDGLQDILFENWVPNGIGGGINGNPQMSLELVTLLSLGDGTFGPPTTDTTFARRHAVETIHPSCATGDFNADRRIDFMCTKYSTIGLTIVIELGIGDGTFREVVEFGPAAIDGQKTHLVVTDVNGDGRGDPIFVVSNTASAGQPAANCYVGNDQVTYCPHWEFTTGIAKDNGGFEWETQVTTTLSEIFPLSRSVLTGDLDGDERSDLVILQQTQNDTRLTTVRNLRSGSVRWSLTGQQLTGTGESSKFALADTDTDGAAELLVAFFHKNNNAYCGDPGTGPHWSVATGFPLLASNTFFSGTSIDENFQCGRDIQGYPRAADVNGDGRMDWIGVRAGTTANTVVLDDQPAIHRNASKRAWRRADVNGDGREDWVAVIFGNPGLEVYTVITLPNGTFSWSNLLFPPSSLGEAASADVVRDWVAADVGGPSSTPDGLTDIVVVDDATGIVTTFLAQGDGTWVRATPVNHGLPTRRSPQPWLSFDVDGDGRVDLVRLERTTVSQGGSTTTPATAVRVLRSLGNGGWAASSTPVWTGTVTPRLSAFKPIDLDGDGRGDLVQIMTTQNQNATGFTTIIRTLRSSGNGTYTADSQPITQPHVDGERYSVADINGDGRGDLARLNFLPASAPAPNGPTVASLQGIGNGRFSGPATWGVQGTMSALSREHRGFRAADLDEDGRTDFYNVMVERDSMGAVTTGLQVVWNRASGVFGQSTTGLALTGTDVSQFQLDDFDSDGRPDLVRLGLFGVERIRLGAPTTRMTEHTNGTGGRTRIIYTTSVGPRSILPAGLVVPLVAQVSAYDDTKSATVAVETTTYAYHTLQYHFARRQLVGPDRIEATTGRTKTVSWYQLDTRCGARVYKNELRDVADAVIARTTFGFVPDTMTSDAPFTCLIQDEIYEQCEGLPFCRTTTDHTYYDAFGNAQQVWEEGNPADATDDRVTITPANTNVGAWIVSLPAYKLVYGQEQSGGSWYWRLFAYSDFEYDYTPWTPPAVGYLTAERKWNDQTGGFATTSISYDQWGNVEKRRGPGTPHAPGGYAETVVYDCTFHRFPEQICTGLGCSSIEWDLAKQLKSTTTDLNGQMTAMFYDPLGRVVRIDQPDGGSLTWEHPDWTAPSAAQKVRSMVSDDSPNDHVFWVDAYLDGFVRTWRTTEEGGRSTDVEFDGVSERAVKESHPYLVGQSPLWTQTTYDAANRIIAVTMPDGRTRRNLHRIGYVTMLDELSGVRDAFTDHYGRVVAIQEHLRKCFNGGDVCPPDEKYLTTYGWDPLDRQIWIQDTKGNLTTSRYDSLSNRLEACTPDRGCEIVQYADDGLPLVEVDANSNVRQIEYDYMGRERIRRTIASGGGATRTVEYGWDVNPATGLPIGSSIGRLVSVDDQSNVSIQRLRGYDSMGRLMSQQDCVQGQCMPTSYDYDIAGRMRTITYPDASTVDHHYDHRGLLVAMPGYATFVYDDATYRPTKTIYNNAVVEEHVYSASRLWIDEVSLSAKNGMFSEVVTHDAKGRVRHTETLRPASQLSMDFSYDDLDRVRVVTSSDPTLDGIYDYDGIGNKIKDSARGTIDYGDPAHVHAPTSTGSGQMFTYDSLGQLLLSDRKLITWNEDGNPIAIKDVMTGAFTEYGYDVDGQRVMRTGSTGTELTFGSLVDLDAHGVLVKYIPAHGQAIARVYASDTTYLHRDHLGSVRALTDGTGNIVDERDYGTWGAPTGTFSLPSVVQAFAGLARDDEQGLMLLGARYYDPEAAAFLSADNIVPDVYLPQTLNAYSYAMNNPATLVDPSGHDPDGEWEHYKTDYGSIDVFTPETGEVPTSQVPDYVTPALQEQYVVEEGWFESIVSGNTEPSFGKGLIPFVGSAQSMFYHYKHGNYVRGVLYTGLLVSDVFMVGTIGKGVIKVGIKGGATLLASEFAQGVRLMVTGNWRRFGDTFRLLTGRAKYGLKELFYNPSAFKNVSKQYWRGTANANGSQLQHLWVMNSTRWVPQGIRNAGFNLLEVPAAFNHWMSNGFSNVVFRLGLKTGLQAEVMGIYNATQELLGLREPEARPQQPQQPQQLQQPTTGATR